MRTLFDTQPRITVADKKRLEPSMASWTKLSPAMAAMSEDDLKRCVLIEAAKPDPRIPIVERLLGRYNITTRTRILDALKNPRA